MSRDYDDNDTWSPHSILNSTGANFFAKNGKHGLATVAQMSVADRRLLELERRRALRLARKGTHGEWIEEQRRDYLERCAAFALFDLTQQRKCVARAFGRLMRKHRTNIGFTQEEVAAIMGIDRTYPSLLERGLRCPTVGIANSVALCMRVPPLVWQTEFQDALRDEVKAHKLLEKRIAKMDEKTRMPRPGPVGAMPKVKHNRHAN